MCFRFYCLFKFWGFFAHLCRIAWKKFVVFFFSLEVCLRQILQSTDIRVCLNSHHVALTDIHRFRGLSSTTGKAPRDLPDMGKTVQKWFISCNIYDPLWFWGFGVCFFMSCLIPKGLSDLAAGWKALGEPCSSFHPTRDGSGCCFQPLHLQESNTHRVKENGRILQSLLGIQ